MSLRPYEHDTIEHAPIDAADTGDTLVVAAVAGERILVLSVLLVASSAVTVKFKSGDTAEITGPIALDAKGGFSAEARYGLFKTAAGEALNINLDGAFQVGGSLSYIYFH